MSNDIPVSTQGNPHVTPAVVADWVVGFFAMCGRYTARKLRLADYDAMPRFEEITEKWIVLRFNVAPSQFVPVVRLDKDGRRVADLVKWGLIPSWTKGKPKLQPINARVETVATSGMFKQAFLKRRCLQAADGFYEWKKVGTAKHPHFIHLKSDAPYAFAGLWERWKPDDHDESVDTVCHITTRPNKLMATLHDRMPVILERKDFARWLDPATTPDELLALLQPLPDGELDAYEVGAMVGSPKNQGPDLIAPV